MRQFRSSQGTDPEVFLTAIVTVLMHYPLDVAEQAADPYFGLPALQPFTPSPYDVKQFCERIMLPRRNKIAWDQRSAQQLESSREIKKGVIQSVEEIEDEMAKRGIFLPGYIKRSGQVSGRNQETADEFRRRAGLSQCEWDALPNDTARGGVNYKPPEK